jgi:hypothetical protein
MLNVLFNEGVDVLATIFGVVDLHGVLMGAQMNAHTLSGLIVIDVEDFGMAWCSAPRRLFTNFAH